MLIDSSFDGENFPNEIWDTSANILWNFQEDVWHLYIAATAHRQLSICEVPLATFQQ